MDKPKTNSALLTPRGRGAVAVIALAGADAEKVLDSNFKPINRKLYSSQSQRKIVYGVWDSTGEDLVVYRRSQINFEVHCHGGNMASKAILDDLTSADIEQVSPQEFIKSSGELIAGNLWKSEVLIALSQATTKRTAEILLQQHLALPQAIEAIEAQIQAGNFESAIAQIELLTQWAEFGIQLTQSRTVVFCGQPNVGKSSLVNAIVGFQRAIVNEVAGTTRDVVSQSTAISGWPVELKDTAGLRDSENVIESIGIEKARSEIASADLRICVFDATKQPDADDQELINSINPSLIVFNKLDLAVESEVQTRLSETPDSIATSVESGNGIELLIQQIGARLTQDLPDSEQALPVSADQVIRLEEVAAILNDNSTSKPESNTDKLAATSLALKRLKN